MLSSKSFMLLLATTMALMTTVCSFDYDEAYPEDDKLTQQLQGYLDSKPRYARNDGWNWGKNYRGNKLSLEVAMPRDDFSKETRLVRASRLKDIQSLDSTFRLDFKPRFGKREQMFDSDDKHPSMIKSDLPSNWFYVSRRR